MKVFLVQPEYCRYGQNSFAVVVAKSDVNAMLITEEANESERPMFEEDQRPMKITELNMKKEYIAIVSAGAK